MSSFSERLKSLRNRKGLSQEQLAEYTDIPRSSIVHYESSKNITTRYPRMDRLQSIANYFNVTIDYLLGRTDDPTENIYSARTVEEPPSIEGRVHIKQEKIPVGQTVFLPVYGTVKAGPGGLAYTEPLGEFPAEIKDINLMDTNYWLKVKGDSMYPEIQDGDYVLVREQPDVETGELAVVVLNGDESTVKRVHKGENSVTLIAANPTYPSIIISGQALKDFHIVGRVKMANRKY